MISRNNNFETTMTVFPETEKKDATLGLTFGLRTSSSTGRYVENATLWL
jgi:hypothetical protein